MGGFVRSLMLFVVFACHGCVPLPSPYAASEDAGEDAALARDADLEAGRVDAAEQDAAPPPRDADTVMDAAVAVDAAVPLDAAVSMDAGRDARTDDCASGSFFCDGASPDPEQPRVPGTLCCCEWELSPNASGGCG